MSRRYLVSDWDGCGVIRSTWRKAKAENRRANRLTYCASIKATRMPLRDGAVLMDGRYQGDNMPFHAASRIARRQIQEGA